MPDRIALSTQAHLTVWSDRKIANSLPTNSLLSNILAYSVVKNFGPFEPPASTNFLRTSTSQVDLSPPIAEKGEPENLTDIFDIVNNKVVRISIWDSILLDQSKNTRNHTSSETDIFLFLFDLAKKSTLDGLRDEKAKLDKLYDKTPPCILLVGVDTAPPKAAAIAASLHGSSSLTCTPVRNPSDENVKKINSAPRTPSTPEPGDKVEVITLDPSAPTTTNKHKKRKKSFSYNAPSIPSEDISAVARDLSTSSFHRVKLIENVFDRVGELRTAAESTVFAEKFDVAGVTALFQEVRKFVETPATTSHPIMPTRGKRKPIPYLVISCFSYLERYVTTTRQIFCFDGDATLMHSMYEKFMKGKKINLEDYPQNSTTAHTVVCVVKKFLLACQESLIPLALKDMFLSIADVSVKCKKTFCNVFLRELPAENRYILLYLIQLLGQAVENQERTHVDSNHLSKVMAPYLLFASPRSGITDSTALAGAASNGTVGQTKLQLALKVLIDNYVAISKEWSETTNALVTISEEQKHRFTRLVSSKESLLLWAPLQVQRKLSGPTHNIMHKFRRQSVPDASIDLQASEHQAVLRDLDKGISPEHQYAHDGDLVELQKSIKESPYLMRAIDDMGNTLLHYAAMGANNSQNTTVSDVATFLLDQDESLQFVNRRSDGKTPLHIAIDLGKSGRDLVNIFLKRSSINDSSIALLSRKTKNGRTLLHYAARNDCIESITLLASRLTDLLHAQDLNGCTPLHYAARNENFREGGQYQQEQLLFLIRKLASPLSINCRDIHGDTPLHYAVQRKDPTIRSIIQILGSVDTLIATNDQGMTPLHVAINANSLEAVDGLLKLASSYAISKQFMQARDIKGKTALHYAADHHFVELVNRVIGDDATANLTDYQGSTALHLSCKSTFECLDPFNQLQTLTFLGLNSSTINRADLNGRTPLFYVNTKEAVQCLVGLGADVNALDLEDTTPLDHALSREQPAVSNELISLGGKKGEEIVGSSNTNSWFQLPDFPNNNNNA